MYDISPLCDKSEVTVTTWGGGGGADLSPRGDLSHPGDLSQGGDLSHTWGFITHWWGFIKCPIKPGSSAGT